MSHELISILALVAMFIVATLVPVNMGILAFVGAFMVGTLVAGMTANEVIGGFPGGLFLTLVGITYLFAIAQNNGTIDWLVDWRSALSGKNLGDPLDHVLNRSHPHVRRRSEPRGSSDCGSDRTGFRLSVWNQPVDDGTDGHSRRSGGWFLPNQHLWWYHRQRRRGRWSAVQ